MLDTINFRATEPTEPTENTENTEKGLMNYLINPDISEEIDGRETDPLTGNIIGAAIEQ